MDNISLGYTFNKLSSMINKSARVYVTVQNPFVITPNMMVLDPEISGGG